MQTSSYGNINGLEILRDHSVGHIVRNVIRWSLSQPLIARLFDNNMYKIYNTELENCAFSNFMEVTHRFIDLYIDDIIIKNMKIIQSYEIGVIPHKTMQWDVNKYFTKNKRIKAIESTHKFKHSRMILLFYLQHLFVTCILQ